MFEFLKKKKTPYEIALDKLDMLTPLEIKKMSDSEWSKIWFDTEDSIDNYYRTLSYMAGYYGRCYPPNISEIYTENYNDGKKCYIEDTQNIQFNSFNISNNKEL